MKSLQNLMIGAWLSFSKKENCKKLLLVKSLIAGDKLIPLER